MFSRLLSAIPEYSYDVEEEQTGSFQRILVAVDDTIESTWALETASRLGEQMGARLAIVHVVSENHALAPKAGVPMPVSRDELFLDAARFLRQWQEEIAAAVSCELYVRRGDPAQSIVELAQEWGAGLVVVGCHRRGLLGRALHQDVAAWVTQHCPIPVVSVSNSPLQNVA